MALFADVAFPTAVRQLFTYHISEDNNSAVLPGQRVWVPLKNWYAIGVIVHVHTHKPDFKTKPVKRILDKKPVLSEELLTLTKWVSAFYFCSWGEAIQAALPAGLNFISQKKIKVGDSPLPPLSPDEREIINEQQSNELLLDEAKKRWKGTRFNKVFNGLLKRGIIEIWEEPEIKVSPETEKVWNWAAGKNARLARLFLEKKQKAKPPKWELALRELVEMDLPIRNTGLAQHPVLTTYTINKLRSEGWLDFAYVEKEPEFSHLQHAPDALKQLNDEQQAAFNQIQVSLNKQEFSSFLLFGITGSGKTEVYIHALKQALANGRGGIVMVPEIALTPQTISRFYKIFGEEIAVLHSRLSNRERLQAWRSLESGKKRIAIGARSAVFAPVKNLGIIILDEEHDSSYKQADPAPRYHARDTAIMRARQNNAVMIMGSATPSMQALHMAAKGKSTLLELKNRHAEAALPQVKITDLKQYRYSMKGDFALPLFNAIEHALEKKEQVILLYNRRGFASYMQCEDCGHIPQSPECAVSLTYHKNKNMLMCHYSGYARRADTKCEHCGSAKLKIEGSGTQNVEEQLGTFFPQAKILRFDRDSTSGKNSHERILTLFERGDADILVGTQLVAKGLNFPNVTVVGVINADTELAFPSFQATERMYQLLSQVAGRSGRGDKPGVVYLQTKQPDNPAIIFAQSHNHKGFSRQELAYRKPLYYPPYSRLISFILKSGVSEQAHSAAYALHNSIRAISPDLPLLGPAPGAIPWMNKKFIWEVTLKVEPDKGAAYIENLISKAMENYRQAIKGRLASVRINVNVDAIQ